MPISKKLRRKAQARASFYVRWSDTAIFPRSKSSME